MTPTLPEPEPPYDETTKWPTGDPDELAAIATEKQFAAAEAADERTDE